MQFSLLDIAERYPHSPGYRVGGASKDAAVAMKERAPTIQARVLAAVKASPHGLTADECADELKLSPLAVRPRFSELYETGWIVKTGIRRKNDSGMTAHVWVALPREGR